MFGFVHPHVVAGSVEVQNVLDLLRRIRGLRQAVVLLQHLVVEHVQRRAFALVRIARDPELAHHGVSQSPAAAEALRHVIVDIRAQINLAATHFPPEVRHAAVAQALPVPGVLDLVQHQVLQIQHKVCKTHPAGVEVFQHLVHRAALFRQVFPVPAGKVVVSQDLRDRPRARQQRRQIFVPHRGPGQLLRPAAQDRRLLQYFVPLFALPLQLLLRHRV